MPHRQDRDERQRQRLTFANASRAENAAISATTPSVPMPLSITVQMVVLPKANTYCE